MANHESRESPENEGLTGPVIRVPFTKIECPELNGLPSEERQRILQKCCQSPEMEKLSRQYMIVVRLAMVPLLLSIPLLFWGRNVGLQDKHLVWLGPFAMGFLIAAFIGSIWVYHKRSSQLLKRLIAKEIARSNQTNS